ncbi:MAG: hypothetical protein SVS15_09805 [Thermodesulfobacteriota bacterium]|nr:hypothetical protein [Thermodesulfobacteriota bacterium]
MENVESCAFIVQKQEDVYQCSRSTLGLAVENLYSFMFALDLKVDMTDEVKENLEMLVEDMECECFSNNKENPEPFQYMSTEDMAAKINEQNLIIPFGSR